MANAEKIFIHPGKSKETFFCVEGAQKVSRWQNQGKKQSQWQMQKRCSFTLESLKKRISQRQVEKKMIHSTKCRNRLLATARAVLPKYL